MKTANDPLIYCRSMFKQTGPPLTSGENLFVVLLITGPFSQELGQRQAKPLIPINLVFGQTLRRTI